MTAILPRIDYMLHLQPVCDETRMLAQKLETLLSSWILQYSGKAYGRTKALLRMAPLLTRRECMALRNLARFRERAKRARESDLWTVEESKKQDWALQALRDFPRCQELRVEQKLRSSGTSADWVKLARKMGAHTQELSWRRESAGKRVIPRVGPLPPVYYLRLRPEAEGTATAFYLNTFPLPVERVARTDFQLLCELLALPALDDENKNLLCAVLEAGCKSRMERIARERLERHQIEGVGER